jgi:hypothetical protein
LLFYDFLCFSSTKVREQEGGIGSAWRQDRGFTGGGQRRGVKNNVYTCM